MTKRRIVPMQTPGIEPADIASSVPVVELVDPKALLVDEVYQRNLSERSVRLIRKIVGAWDWARFKPPICARTPDGLEVIDGQHTAIAAASHPHIKAIPVMVVEAETLASRAAAFVGHNRDRIGLTATQIFFGSLAAGDEDAETIAQVCKRSKVRILKNPPSAGLFKAGDTMAIASIGSLINHRGALGARKVLEVLGNANAAPIRADQIKAVETLLHDPEYAGQVDADAITTAIISLGDEAEREARVMAATHNIRHWKALTIVLFRRSRRGRRRAA